MVAIDVSGKKLDDLAETLFQKNIEKLSQAHARVAEAKKLNSYFALLARRVGFASSPFAR